MASQDDIDAAGQNAKLALLRQIKASAEATKVASQLERLAYALTVGAAFSKLPGGPTHIDVSKYVVLRIDRLAGHRIWQSTQLGTFVEAQVN